MSGGLAIFVKTPGLSPLKTRLAAGVGRDTAQAWYLLAAQAVMQVAGSMDDIEAAFAVAEESPEAEAFWGDFRGSDKPVPCISQGQGSLGHRMAKVYAKLLSRHRFAILIGADAPQLNNSDLQAAGAWLDSPEPRLCLGPASDGGFWLFGGNRPLPLQAWLVPQYSAPDTAAQFQQAMQDHGDWLKLRELTDVDTAVDLRRASSELHALATPHPAQSSLLRWMQSGLTKDE